MKWSFYEFSELVNEHKQQLMEMPMRPMGSPDQYGSSANPHKTNTSVDGYEGKNTRANVHDTEQGQALDRAAKKASWADYEAENPEAAKAYSQMGQALRKDRSTPDPLAAHDQVNAIIGRRKVGTGESANSALEKALAGDFSKEGQMAKQIDKIISDNPKAFASRPMTKMEIIDTILEMMPRGGIGSGPSKQDIAQGFVKLHNLAKQKLLVKTDDGNYRVNVAVTTGGGSGGVDIESEIEKSGISGTDAIQKVPDQFAKTMDKLKSVIKEKGMKNDHAHKLAQRAKQLADSLKRGHDGGIILGGHEEMYQAIQDEIKLANQVIAKNNTSKGASLSDLLGQ